MCGERERERERGRERERRENKPFFQGFELSKVSCLGVLFIHFTESAFTCRGSTARSNFGTKTLQTLVQQLVQIINRQIVMPAC